MKPAALVVAVATAAWVFAALGGTGSAGSGGGGGCWVIGVDGYSFVPTFGGTTNVIKGSPGDYGDNINCSGSSHPVTIKSGGGNDTITGSQYGDTLEGGKGDDAMNGLGGDDVLKGGFGEDTMDGGNNTDLCLGGQDDDADQLNCEAPSDNGPDEA
jgi:Ca2+-binding RTX toxin-like protein